MEKGQLMRENIKLFGDLLGDTIKEALGENMLDLVEQIRRLSKTAYLGDAEAHEKLLNTLKNLSDSEFLPVAQAFNQMLNLINTAEQYDTISPHSLQKEYPVNFEKIYNELKQNNLSDEEIKKAVDDISIDLVLTAHPTEINRRSLINNLNEVSECIRQLDHDDLAGYQKEHITRRLRQLLSQYWYTNEIRENRPTPSEEAKWGMDVIENSLWNAVPFYLRNLDEQLVKHLDYSLSLEAQPIRFSSWMGGDRDGNPNVTADVTREVLLKTRRRAAKLFLADIEVLVKELSMSKCTPDFRSFTGDECIQEPYRDLMKQLRVKLRKTLTYLDARIEGQDVEETGDIIISNDQLWIPLYKTYKSLISCGMNMIADGNLRDTLRRVQCFGVNLIRLDIRQESTRHTDALSEITEYLELGNYGEWSEEERQKFLLKELQSKRPLVPKNWSPSYETKEVLETCQVIAETPRDALVGYVISMTCSPSDVLAVYLLQKEAGCPYYLPVAPLFETLNDLNNADSIMQALFKIDWYRETINKKQMVMIGYSDSAKDAGSLAAGWAQYRGQEALIKTCSDAGVKLTLFHGRGGTVGRGGGPAKVALFSQPPGSLKGGLRVTEQGEMIRFKFGIPDLAVNTLSLYVDAILEANLLPPPAPKQEWRNVMDELSDISRKSYRGLVHENPDFITYFYQATPEAELAKLPLGSRPAKRRKTGGIETLRAIPWIFGWTQNRLMLPAWLGAGEALQKLIDKGEKPTLEQMYKTWPFFNTRISMLEMVFAKSDAKMSQYYDTNLIDPQYLEIGEGLREQLKSDIVTVLDIAHDDVLMQSMPEVAKNIALRNVYTNPLNLIQVELLRRCRKDQNPNSELEQALMVTISGIAAGMRNTG